MKHTKCFFIALAFFAFSAPFIMAEGINEAGSARRGRSYYVSAAGSDFYNGLSEQAAYKTLAKAVDSASNSSVKRITVMGTLDSESEAPTFHFNADPDSVFCIAYSGTSEITIGGRPDSIAELRGGGGKRVMTIRGHSHILFENILITGGDTDYEGGGIFSEEGAAIILGAGAVISGNKSSEGGGVYIREGSLSLVQNAAIVQNRIATNEGGGAVVLLGVFSMADNSQISGNTSSGLILVGSEGVMSGNAAITENVSGSNGGGVRAYLSNFTMRGTSRISGNFAVDDGGGVYIESGRLVLLGVSSISENEAGNDGGGVNLEDASIIVQGEAVISGNASGDDGGGIHSHGGYVVLSENASLTNNESSCGGGLCIENYASAIIRGRVNVSGNAAFGNQGGGGLCAGYNSSIHILGGEIYHNVSTNGGGVYIEDSSLIVDAGFIFNNKADSGGGIFLKGSSFLKADESLVKDNSPDNIKR